MGNPKNANRTTLTDTVRRLLSFESLNDMINIDTMRATLPPMPVRKLASQPTNEEYISEAEGISVSYIPHPRWWASHGVRKRAHLIGDEVLESCMVCLSSGSCALLSCFDFDVCQYIEDVDGIWAQAGFRLYR